MLQAVTPAVPCQKEPLTLEQSYSPSGVSDCLCRGGLSDEGTQPDKELGAPG